MLKLKCQYFGHLTWTADSLKKTLMLGKIECRRRWGLTEDEMVGWHHQLSGHEFEQTPGDSEGQGSLACCSPWGCKESDTTYWLNNSLPLWCPAPADPASGSLRDQPTPLTPGLWGAGWLAVCWWVWTFWGAGNVLDLPQLCHWRLVGWGTCWAHLALTVLLKASRGS